MQLHLAGHETFYPRQHWLSIGVEAICKEPQLFHRRSSFPTDRLGVGINMVRSILYWLRALGLIEKGAAQEARQAAEGGQKIAGYRLSSQAEQLLRYDRQLDWEETLWILHYNLVSQPDRATTWHWFFGHSGLISFTREQFLARLKKYIIQNSSQKFSPHSLEKDLQVLLRMYRSQQIAQQSNGQQGSFYPSPFTKLNLLTLWGEEERYIRTQQPKIAAEVFVYLLLRYIEQYQPQVTVIDLRKLAEKPSAPFKAIGMEAKQFYQLHESLPAPIRRRLQLSYTAGIWTITVVKLKAEEMLPEIYREKRIPRLL